MAVDVYAALKELIQRFSAPGHRRSVRCRTRTGR